MKKISIKLIILSIFLLSIMGCAEDIKEAHGIEYSIIDTTHIEKNAFNNTLGYNIIILIDSSYYGAYMTKYGKVIRIQRKLKYIKP